MAIWIYAQFLFMLFLKKIFNLTFKLKMYKIALASI